MKRIILLSLSIAATGILFSRASFKLVALLLVASIICSCIIYLIEKFVTQPENAFVHKRFIILDILLVSWLMIRFYSKWGTNSFIMTLMSNMYYCFCSRHYCIARD